MSIFGTLRYVPNAEQPKVIEFTDGAKFFEAGMPQHLACQSCRERKLRCDRQKPSCERCSNSGIACNYTPGNQPRRRKIREPTERSQDASGPYPPARKTTKTSHSLETSQQKTQDFGTDLINLPMPRSTGLEAATALSSPDQMLWTGSDDFDFLDFDGLSGAGDQQLERKSNQQNGESSNEWSLPGKEASTSSSVNPL